MSHREITKHKDTTLNSLKITLNRAPLLVAALLLCFAATSQANTYPELEGYYVKNGTEYASIEVFITMRFGFHKLKDIEFVERKNEQLFVHVYKKDWTLEKSRFYVKEIVVGKSLTTTDVIPKVKDLGDNHFLLKLPNAASNKILFIQDWNDEYAMTLGNPVNEVVNAVQNTDMAAYVVLSDLKEALKSYPKNKDLQAQLPKWEKARALEVDNKEWKYVQRSWARYKKSESRDSKLHHLKKSQHLLNAYLNKFAKGTHRKEAKNRLKVIKEKLAL